MNLKTLLLLVITFCYHYTSAQVIVNNSDSYSLNGNISLLKEESNMVMSVEQAWRNYRHHKFSSFDAPTGIINIGFVKNIYWVAIPLRNSSTQLQELESGIANGGIFELEFYLVSSPAGIVLKKHVTGDTYNSHTRGIFHRHFYFPFSLQGAESAVIFFRVNAIGNGMLLPLKLNKRHYTQYADSTTALLFAFFSGWLSFVFMFSLLVLLITREYVYLWYALYVLCSCLFFVADGDFDVIWLYPDWSWLGTINPITYALWLTFFMLLFMNSFLFIRKTHPRLFGAVKVSAGILIIAFVLVVIGYGFMEIAGFRKFVYYFCFAAFVIAWVTQIACLVARILEHYKPAFFYAFALSGVFIALVIYFLTSIGIVNAAILPSSLYVPFALAIEIIMMSLALVYSYNFYKKKEQQLSSALTRQQLDFSEQLLNVQESEQKRIAEDLHDELGGNLAAIKMRLQSMSLPDNNKHTLLSMIDTASDNARTIAHNLMPPEFREARLWEMLQDYVNNINEAGVIRVNLFVPASLEGHFSKHEELAIYRIISELARNILRHSGATEATIQLIDYTSALEIMVEDNGGGFDVSSRTGSGVGLTSIHSRVNYLQGAITIDSNPSGTTTMIRIPYQTKVSA